MAHGDSNLLATLKRHNPSKVKAYAGDDDVRDIAVPTRRRKWAQVIEAIEARAWSRVELLDKSGAVLGYVENTAPAVELEVLSDGRTAPIREAERVAALVLSTTRSLVKDIVESRDKEMSALLQAQGSVVREMAAGIREMGQMYREQVDVASDVAAQRAEHTAAAAAAANGGGNDELKQLLEALPVIMQALPLLRSMLGAGSTTPKNGHRKEPPP